VPVRSGSGVAAHTGAIVTVLALLSVPAALPAVAATGPEAARDAVAAPGPPGADPWDDLSRADEAVARAASMLEGATGRARRAAARYAAATSALPEAEAAADRARGEVAAARVLARSAVRRAEAAQADRAAADRRHRTSVAEVERARARVDEVVVAAYQGSGLAGATALLDAAGPVELAERMGYLDRIVETERAAVTELAAARLHARQAQNEAIEAHRLAERERVAADRALDDARTAEAAAEATLAEVTELAASRADALAAADSERDATRRRYERAQAEAARVAAELRAWETDREGGPVLRPGARLLMPARGWKSSNYGMRFDPFFRLWQMHSGVDIAAGGGAPVYAAASGVVVWAGWNGGYGNFTCLSHGTSSGRGLSTCYAHQARVLVRPGQVVARGEVIGRVGTTGASTGTHLHFEVRLDGTPTDPLRWLPSCLC
jgi:murein DD-endopeptidase MepM/ murein hydrolase activator NlpD